MAGLFKLRISNELFEQSHISRNTLNKTYEGSSVCDVEEIQNLYIKFVDYITENGAAVGVRLSCEMGHGYGFDNGIEIAELRPGEMFDFRYEGTSVDDEGCPEDFSIHYYLALYRHDEI